MNKLLLLLLLLVQLGHRSVDNHNGYTCLCIGPQNDLVKGKVVL